MGRGAEFEGAEHAAEALGDIVVVVAEDAEGFVHDFGVVVADGAGADFVAVHDHIVLVGDDLEFVVGFAEGLEPAFREGEGVVAEVEFLGAVVPFVEGEVHHPTEGDDLVVFEAEDVGEGDAHDSEDAVDVSSFASAEENGITVLGAGETLDGGEFGFGEEFGDRASHGIVLVEDVGKAAGAVATGEIGELIDLLAGELGAAWDADGFDAGGLENFEAGGLEGVGEIDELEAVAEVGFVGAVFFHHFAVGVARNVGGEEGFAGKIGDEVFDERLDGLTDNFAVIHEGHFEVELVEIAVEAVGAGVFVAETGGDLVVARDATDHEELFELLGGLGEGVELAWMEARGDEEVASAFRGRVGENGGGNFDEVVGIHVVAHETIELGAALQDALSGGATEIEIAVFEAELLARGGAFVVSVDGERFGFVDEGELGNDDFEIAGGEIGVFQFGSALADDAGGRNHEFVAESFGDFEGGGSVGSDDELDDAGVIAQVNENQATVVAAGIDPAGKVNGLVGIGFELGG